jgi:hypothetical protein
MNKNFILFSVIVGVCILTFVNVLNNNFVNYDDTIYITNNQRIKGEKLSDAIKLFNPVQFLKGTLPKKLNEYLPVRDLSFWIDYQLGDLNPLVFHLTNLIIYIFLCTGFFILFVKIIKNHRIALLSTLLYSVHPLHTENVAWVSARKDLLSALFYVLSFISFINFSKIEDKKIKNIWYILSLLLFLAGWLSKPLVITLPAILVLYGLYERKNIKQIIVNTLPFWIFDIMFFLVNTIVVKGVTPLLKGPEPGLFTGINYIGYYIYLFLFPLHLAPVREPMHTFTLLHFILSTLFLITAFLITLKDRKLLFFFLFSLLNLAPVLNLTIYANYNVHDRYMIIPSAGFSVLLTGMLYGVKRENLRSFILIFFYSILMFLSVLQNSKWHDSITLWKHNLDFYPASSIAHLNLGSAFSNNGMDEEAEREYWTVINLPDAIPEMRSDAFYNLGILKIKSRELKESLIYLEKALKDSPEPGRIHRIIGGIFVKLKEPTKAIEHYELSLKLDPNQADRFMTEEIIKKLKSLPPPEGKP